MKFLGIGVWGKALFSKRAFPQKRIHIESADIMILQPESSAVVAPEVRAVTIHGRDYSVELYRNIHQPPEAPRLVVVAHQPNGVAADIVGACLDAVARFTPEPHEVWVVDNNSPREFVRGLCERSDVNVALNRTEPLPPKALVEAQAGQVAQLNWGSYANAIGLELGTRLMDQRAAYVVTMHMDSLPCKAGWLSYLKSKMGPKVRAAGVRLDTTRVSAGVLHVLGFMVDFRLFRELGLDFFPELPALDVGDRVTVGLRAAGYGVFAARNSLWEPELVDLLPHDSVFREFHVDRSFDDDNEVFFLHLGRGLRKSSGEHRKGFTAQEWVRTVRERLLT